MKAEIRAGARKAHVGVTLDEETKNELIRRGREQARASFTKNSPLQSLRLPELRMFPHGVLLTLTVSRARSAPISPAALLGVNRFFGLNWRSIATVLRLCRRSVCVYDYDYVSSMAVVYSLAHCAKPCLAAPSQAVLLRRIASALYQ